MKRFLVRLSVLMLLNLAVFTAAALLPLRFQYPSGTGDSILNRITENTSYDFVMLGTSHGNIFSHGGNHAQVENLLQKKFLNLSKGNGEGSMFEETLFLSWFYDRGNTAPTAVYFIDPWTFYSRKWNEGNYFLADEPLNLEFLARAYQAGTDQDVLVNYFKTKISPEWIATKPATTTEVSDILHTVYQEGIKARIDALYLDGENPDTFDKYARELDALVALANAHGTKVIFIVPATLLGTLPQEEHMLEYLESLKKTRDVAVYDYSASMPDKKYFYNLDHLNTVGILLFTKKYLSPLLSTEKLDIPSPTLGN